MNESFPKNSDAIITRHSIKGKGSEYNDLSAAGVEKAKERANDFIEIVEQSEPGTVILFGGNSNEARTESTLEVYADTVKTALGDKPDVLFFDQDSLVEKTQRGHLSAAEEIREEANNKPEARVVIGLPLVLKDFNKQEWWYEQDGSVKAVWQALLDKHGKDYSSAIREWFTNQGVYDGEQKVPSPVEVAESQLNGIKRLQAFIQKFSGDRKVKLVVVGHSFHIDALLVYLANKGVVDVGGFEKIGGEVVDTTEMALIEADKDGHLQLKYRDKEFSYE